MPRDKEVFRQMQFARRIAELFQPKHQYHHRPRNVLALDGDGLIQKLRQP